MNMHATQDDDRQAPQMAEGQAGISDKAEPRFTFKSGARPLDGYTIKRGIGRGGFGEVYYAVSDGGKEVAVKLIRRNFDMELRGVAHCMNLKHPNLLELYDVRSDQHDDRWVVMEYVSGECLEDIIIAQPDGMPIEEVIAWMHGIVAGVAYLHECGIVHRDLKPGNIFSEQGLVKIGDYGLSKFMSCSRRSGQTESVGTVHYMAPEISNGRYGKEIDIYALGVMLYEMLTGRVPFEGESVGEVLMKHLTAKPDVSMLSEPYRSIVKRALAK
ncbi:MAG: serine/threonine protein kinase, partial [Planctomycetales bacterium]